MIKNEIAQITWKEHFKTCEIIMDKVAYNGEVEEMRTQGDSCAFMPTELESLKAFIGDDKHPIVGFLNGKWTPEVIAESEARQRESEL